MAKQKSSQNSEDNTIHQKIGRGIKTFAHPDVDTSIAALQEEYYSPKERVDRSVPVDTNISGRTANYLDPKRNPLPNTPTADVEAPAEPSPIDTSGVIPDADTDPELKSGSGVVHVKPMPKVSGQGFAKMNGESESIFIFDSGVKFTTPFSYDKLDASRQTLQKNFKGATPEQQDALVDDYEKNVAEFVKRSGGTFSEQAMTHFVTQQFAVADGIAQEALGVDGTGVGTDSAGIANSVRNSLGFAPEGEVSGSKVTESSRKKMLKVFEAVPESAERNGGSSVEVINEMVTPKKDGGGGLLDDLDKTKPEDSAEARRRIEMVANQVEDSNAAAFASEYVQSVEKMANQKEDIASHVAQGFDAEILAPAHNAIARGMTNDQANAELAYSVLGVPVVDVAAGRFIYNSDLSRKGVDANLAEVVSLTQGNQKLITKSIQDTYGQLVASGDRAGANKYFNENVAGNLVAKMMGSLDLNNAQPIKDTFQDVMNALHSGNLATRYPSIDMSLRQVREKTFAGMTFHNSEVDALLQRRMDEKQVIQIEYANQLVSRLEAGEGFIDEGTVAETRPKGRPDPLKLFKKSGRSSIDSAADYDQLRLHARRNLEGNPELLTQTLRQIAESEGKFIVNNFGSMVGTGIADFANLLADSNGGSYGEIFDPWIDAQKSKDAGRELVSKIDSYLSTSTVGQGKAEVKAGTPTGASTTGIPFAPDAGTLRSFGLSDEMIIKYQEAAKAKSTASN